MTAGDQPTFARGDQIARLPDDHDGDIDVERDAVEFGFVVSFWPERQLAFCRFWSQRHDGFRNEHANEAVPVDELVRHNSRPQELVDFLVDQINRPTFALMRKRYGK